MKWVALAILTGLVLAAAISVEATSDLLIGTKESVVDRFDWLFVGVATGAVFVVTLFALVPRANVQLGPAGMSPEFGRFAWFAMLFSAGLASGLLYWATAEPIIHDQDNPFFSIEGTQPGTDAAVRAALRITIFHWGLHGWAMYVLGALAIGIYSFRHRRPLTFRTALYPVLGADLIDRWPGRIVDLLALLGTVFGVATSIGLSAASLNATLFPLIGLSVTESTQMGIVFVVCTLGALSAISGVGRGIRRLSELNIWVSSFFLFAVFVLGPTSRLLEMYFVSAWDYGTTFLSMGIWLGTTEAETQWQSAWTVFYWGWWLAWMPFVSLFIARISRGRSVREFILGVMGVPAVMIVIWMVTLGGTALEQERANPGSVSGPVNQDYSLGIATVLEQLASPGIALALTAVAAFLLFSWLITSLDSATLVITHILGTPDVPGQQLLWGLVLATVTASLIWIGGIAALQAVSIVIGLPLAIVLALVAYGLIKDLIGQNL